MVWVLAPGARGARAAQTKTIRLGTAILVLMSDNYSAWPKRLLWSMSSVRDIGVGFGRGSAGMRPWRWLLPQPESATLSGKYPHDLGLWTTPEYSQQGHFYTINQATLVPPVVQQPHPPVYIAATRTPATLEFVVATGQPLLVGMVLDTVEALDLCRRFVRAVGRGRLSHPDVPDPLLTVLLCRGDGRASAGRYAAEPGMDHRHDPVAGTFRSGSEVHHRLRGLATPAH